MNECGVRSAKCGAAAASRRPDAAPSPSSPSSGIRHSALGISRLRTHAQAFTFIEVLFAIIILGIGMIMIAGMLPVAIKQSSDTRDDLIGRATAQSGYSFIRAAIQQDPDAFQMTTPTVIDSSYPSNFASYDAGPDTSGYGRVVPLSYDYVTQHTMLPGVQFRLGQMSGLQASRINSSDPTFQWLGFYRRDPNASSIHVIVLAMRLRNTDPTDRYSVTAGKSTLDQETAWNKGNGPFIAHCKIEDGGALDPDRIIFDGSGDKDDQVAGPGAFVIVNHSTVNPNRNNGRVFQLAQRRADLDASKGGRVWELAPGYDLPPAGPGPDLVIGTDDDDVDTSMATKDVTAWMVGRGQLNPAQPTDAFGGLPQDVSILQVDVPLN